MSSYKILNIYLKQHEDFIKAQGFNAKQILKYVKAKLMDPETVLRRLENKYAKYIKQQHQLMNIEEEINNFDIDKVNEELNKDIDVVYDEIITQELPEPTEEELNEDTITNIKLIENDNIKEKTIEIWFKRGSKTLFKNIKQTIINKIHEIKTIEGVFFQVYYKTDGQIRATTYSLNNNISFEKVKNLLNGDTFELVNNYVEGQDIVIECSDTNKDNINRLTIDMITGIRLTHKKHLFKKLGSNSTTIYCDNGGSFYNYKINETFKDCNPLLNKLLKYQITNDLSNEMFNYNCITWALKMSGKFSEAIINNIKINSYSRYVSRKDLHDLGVKFNIAFRVVKYREDNNEWNNITPNKKIIGSDKNDAIKINLALIEKHYILNEEVEGINKYALDLLKKYI